MTNKTLSNLASTERLNELLEETEKELAEIQPRIDELEQQMQELRELKAVKQRLLTLKMSLSAILDTDHQQQLKRYDDAECRFDYAQNETKLYDYKELSALKTFHPDYAFEEVDKVLKQKNSLNYDMFKAVVFNGGKASTEEIKAYLVQCGVKQPQTGEPFDEVPLTEISSRINYLVRKGILQPLERGSFYTTLGWVDPD